MEARDGAVGWIVLLGHVESVTQMIRGTVTCMLRHGPSRRCPTGRLTAPQTDELTISFVAKGSSDVWAGGAALGRLCARANHPGGGDRIGDKHLRRADGRTIEASSV